VQAGGAGDPHTNSCSNGLTYSYSHAYCNTNSYSHSHSHANGCSHPHRNSYSYSHAHGDSYSYIDPYSNTNTTGQPNANSNRHSYSQYHAVQLCPGTRLLEKPCGVASYPIAAWQRDV
jgi:hypothetical protein